MADVRTALSSYLRSRSDDDLAQLRASAEGLDLAAARKEARDEPGSEDAAARVLAGVIAAHGPDAPEVTDAAKALAQKAPRDASGLGVVLLAGEVLWRLSGQPKLAEPYFRRARRTEPAHPAVLEFYRELFAGEAGASQLMQVLVQARRGAKDPALRLELAREMAALASGPLGSPDRAIEVWRGVLREDGKDPEVAREAAAALRELYETTGKWTALVELLKEGVDRAPDTAARIEVLLEIAQLYRDRLSMDAMALATLQRILELDPHHEQSLRALAETYAKAGRWNDLLAIHGRRVDALREAGDTAGEVELLREVARIWLDELGNPQRALEPLERIRELAPGDAAAREQLVKIHEARKDWRALMALWRQELAEQTGDEARARRVELARLAEERLGDRRQAIALWNEVLEHDPGDAQALRALLRLYEREHRWAAQAEVLRALAAQAEDAAEAAPLLEQLGKLLGDRLRDAEGALQVWEELARLVPGHERALRALRDTYVAAGRWDDLTELYARQERLPDVVEILHSAADRLPEVADRVELYLRVARLCRERLGEPERGVRALERVLAIQPGNIEVARDLVPIYRDQGNWARLMSTYEVLLGGAEDDDARLELLQKLQEVAADKIGSASLTLQWAGRAYDLRPADPQVREALERAAEAADGWDELTRRYEARLAASDIGQDEQLELLDKLATVARDRLFKPDDAQRYYRRIVDLDPTNPLAMSALEEIYEGTRRWDDLTQVYRKRLDVTEDPQARLQTLRALARLQRDRLGDLEAAVSTYREILALAEGDVDALRDLADLHRKLGQWEPLVERLQELRDRTTDGPAQIPVLMELGRLFAHRLHDPDQAIASFLAVLERAPGHADAVRELEQLRDAEPSVALPVARGLLPHYRSSGAREKEAAALEVLVAAEDDPEKRLGLLQDLAKIYEKLDGRQADAYRIRKDLFAARPGDWKNRQTMDKLAVDLGQVADAAQSYQAVLADLAARAEQAEVEGRAVPREEALLRRDLLLELGAMARDRLGQPAEAEAAYREVLHQDETHQGAYEALEKLLSAREAHAELLDLYRRRVDVIFNQREQRELLGRMIRIAREHLQDRDTAIATAQELLDLVPDDVVTLELLVIMQEEAGDDGDHFELEDLLGRWADLVDDTSQRHALQCRRARLRVQRLGDAFGAVDLLGQVLGEDPEHAEARGLLEDMLDVAEVQLQVCALLEPIYERAGDREGRIRILRVRRALAERDGSTDDAVAHLLEIVRIEEQDQGNLDAAFADAREAFLLDPRRQDAREQVERIGLGLGRARDVVAIWQEALAGERIQDPALRMDLTLEVAQTLDQRMGDAEGARAAYQELLAQNPSDVRVAHQAVAALCRLHAESGDMIALVEAKRELLRFVEDPAEQVALRLDIARIQLEELGDRVGAALTYGEVLDIDPANDQALSALEQRFEEEEEWGLLVQVLLHRIEVTSGASAPRTAARLWRRVGDLRREKIGDAQGAIDAYQSVLDLKVGREDTVYALQRLLLLHEEMERWPDVEEELRRLINLAPNDAVRSELLLRTADVVGKRLGRGGDALDLLKRVLDLSPTDARARSMVAGFLEDDETRERATRILTPLYEAEQNWPALLGLEELQARKQPSGRRRLQALLKVAATHEERLADPERAFAVLCAAMKEAADQPELADVLEKVERLGAVPERAEGLLEAYRETVDHILDADLQRRVLRNMGAVALERLGDLEAARAAYERVWESAPGSEEGADVAAALERIYQRQEDHQALVDLLVRKGEQAPDEAARDEALLRAGDLVREHLQRPEEAIALYERLSPAAQERPEVQDRLEPLYEETGRYRELAGHLAKKLSRLSRSELVQAHMRLGRLYGEKLDEPEEGLRHLAAALRLDPDQAVAGSDLERYLADPNMRTKVAEMLEPVFMSVQDWPRLIQIQEIRLEAAEDPAARRVVLLRIARIEEEQLEDLERAFESYVRLFKEDPLDAAVRDHLRRLSGVLGIMERLATLLTECAEEDLAGQEGPALDVVREAAELWSRGLKSPARAVPLYRRLWDANPEDGAAFEALEQALVQSEQWRELVEAYWRASEATLDESRRVTLLKKLARAASDVLDEPEETIRAFAQVLEIDPEDEKARARLEDLYEQTGRHADLLDALRDRLDRTSEPGPRARTYERMAAVQNGFLDDPSGAVDTLEAWLAEQPEDADAVAALERLAESRKDQRGRVVELLRPVYEQQGNVRRLLEIDEWRLSSEGDPVARHELYREMAALSARGEGGAEGAFRILCRALAEPGPEHALAALDAEVERLAEQLGMPRALADALVAAAGAEALADDPERQRNLRLRAARLQFEEGDPAAAVETLAPVLEADPEDADALALMDECLTRLGHHDQLRSVLERRVAVTLDDIERIDLLRRLGRLLEEVMVQPEAAEKAWRELLDLEPNDEEALGRLSRAYERSGSTDELVEVLRRQIEAATDPAARRDLRWQLAGVLREAVKDRAAEVEVLRDILADDPADGDALDALARSLLSQDRHAEAAEVLADRAAVADTDERRAALLVEAARLHAGPLAEPEQALAMYGQVLSLSPGHEGALTDLLAFAEQHEEVSREVLELTQDHLTQAGKWAELAHLWEIRARASQDPAERAEALAALAQIRKERLGDAAGSLAARIEALSSLEGSELAQGVQACAELAVQAGEVERLVDAFEQMVGDVAHDPSWRGVLAEQAARLAEEVMGDPERALALLRPTLDDGAASRELSERIERLARGAGDRDTAAVAMRRVVELCADDGERAGWIVRLGDLEQERDQLEDALDAYLEALDLTPALAGAVAGLEGLLARMGDDVEPRLLAALETAYEAAGNRPGLAQVVRVRLQGADPVDQGPLLERLADLCEQGGGTPAEALEAWGAALAADPLATEPLARLQALARGQDLLPRGAELLVYAMTQAQERGQPLAGVGLAAARMIRADLGDAEGALRVLGMVLAEEPEHPEALQERVEAARAAGAPQALHEALVAAAGVTDDPEAAASLLREAAAVAEGPMAEPEVAAADLERVLELAPEDGEAWTRLFALLAGAGQFEALAEALERRVAVAPDPEERRELRYRLANLLVDKLARSDDAVGVYQDMIGESPDDADALAELEVLLRKAERWSDVRGVLERKLDAAPDEQARIAVYEELARLASERLEDPDDAAGWLRRILEEQPDHAGAAAALEELLVAEERWDDLAEILEARAERELAAGANEAYAQTLARLAEVHATHLGDVDRAQELLGRVLDQDPNNVPAILALAAVYEARGDAGAMRLTLQRAAALEPQGAIGAELHLRLARLADDASARREHLQQALTLDPGNAQAARELLELARKAEDWAQVVYLLELAGSRESDETRRRALLMERVDLMMRELQDPEGALRVLAPEYERVQDDVELNRRVADALFACGRTDEARGMYDWLVQVGRAATRRPKALAHDLTRIARMELDAGRVEPALELLREAYRIDTTAPETLLLLGRAAEEAGDWKEALKVYRTMLLQNADRSGLLRRGDLYVNLARAHVALDERPKALAMLRRGQEEDREHPDIARMLQEL